MTSSKMVVDGSGYFQVVTKYYGVLRAMRASDSDAKKENAVEVMQGYSMIEEELKQRNTKFMGGKCALLERQIS